MNSRSTGGIIGWYRGGKVEIKNTSNYGDIVSFNNCAGGIIGDVTGANWNSSLVVDVLNCVNFGNISSSTSDRVGGMAGRQGTSCAKNYVTIKNFYNAGKTIGNIIGKIFYYNGSTDTKTEVENVYYIQEPALGSGKFTSGNAILKDENEIKSQSFVDLLNQNIGENSDWNKWKLDEKGYPALP